MALDIPNLRLLFNSIALINSAFSTSPRSFVAPSYLEKVLLCRHRWERYQPWPVRQPIDSATCSSGNLQHRIPKSAVREVKMAVGLRSDQIKSTRRCVVR